MNSFRKIKYYIVKNIPAEMYPLCIELGYVKNVGKKCNLEHPCTYTEKIQWAKLHRRNQLLEMLSDKIRVRKWIEEKIGKDYLIPVLQGPYNSAEEIDFDSLPERFVIKANHGSGFNYVVNNKSEINLDKAIKTANSWLDINFAYTTLELQYQNIKPQLYVEENILNINVGDLPDYKFFCFNGKVYCLYVMVNTYPVHTNAKLGICDRDFNLLPYYREDFEPIKDQIEKPENYDKMVEIAEILSTGFSHVRVDLYNIKGKIYFGEMTFSTGSGLFKCVPSEFDEMLGKQWDLTSGI